jgi:hypothetical protein
MAKSKPKQDEWYVEIVEDGTDQVVKRMGPSPRRTAEKIEAGVNINLNHEQFTTRIVEG